MAALPQKESFIFVTASTSKTRIHAHVTSQQHRRKRASRRPPITINPSTAVILRSIRGQRIENELVPKPSPPLPPPTIFQESEELFYNISRAFSCCWSSFPTVDGPLKIEKDLNFGCYYISKNQNQLGIPFIEKGLRQVENALRYNTNQALLEILYSLCFCFIYPQMDIYRLISRHFYQLSLIIFGSTHPITILTRIIYNTSNNPALSKSGRQLFRNAFVLVYQSSLTFFDQSHNIMAIEALRRSILASSEYSSTSGKTFIWDNRLLEHSKFFSDPYNYLVSQRLYALHLHGIGEFQKELSVLEEIYTSLSRMESLTVRAQCVVIRACGKLGISIVEYGEHEYFTSDGLPQDYLARAREVYKATVEAAVRYLGPKNTETIWAIELSASFNGKHGAIAEAVEGMQFAISQVDEFKLTSEDKISKRIQIRI
jgi:hypothetical protein